MPNQGQRIAYSGAAEEAIIKRYAGICRRPRDPLNRENCGAKGKVQADCIAANPLACTEAREFES